MKWSLLFLLLAFGCSSQKNPPPAEAEAKPASPYTVEPCYCMKIFMPVCAGGTVYGNSCEAECKGHKTWTEGKCDLKKK